jgi:hypothetical protein
VVAETLPAEHRGWREPATGFTSGPPGQGTEEELIMNFQTSNLRPDGTTWPPVTPDPPPPPGYVDPIPQLDAALGSPQHDETDGDGPPAEQDGTKNG